MLCHAVSIFASFHLTVPSLLPLRRCWIGPLFCVPLGDVHRWQTVEQNSLIVVFCFCPVREQLREQTKQYEKSENDLKALQSVGQVRRQAQRGHKQDVPLAATACLLFIPVDCWRSAQAADGGEM